jgi:predicted transcriptional regulator
MFEYDKVDREVKAIRQFLGPEWKLAKQLAREAQLTVPQFIRTIQTMRNMGILETRYVKIQGSGRTVQEYRLKGSEVKDEGVVPLGAVEAKH